MLDKIEMKIGIEESDDIKILTVTDDKLPFDISL